MQEADLLGTIDLADVLDAILAGVVVIDAEGAWVFPGLIESRTASQVSPSRTSRTGPRIGSILLYLAMGWACVLALDSLQVLMPPASLTWLMVGGVFYTSGIVFYILDSWYPWCHGIWHLFVLAGSVSHYFAILLL